MIHDSVPGWFIAEILVVYEIWKYAGRDTNARMIERSELMVAWWVPGSELKRRFTRSQGQAEGAK